VGKNAHRPKTMIRAEQLAVSGTDVHFSCSRLFSGSRQKLCVERHAACVVVDLNQIGRCAGVHGDTLGKAISQKEDTMPNGRQPATIAASPVRLSSSPKDRQVFAIRRQPLSRWTSYGEAQSSATLRGPCQKYESRPPLALLEYEPQKRLTPSIGNRARAPGEILVKQEKVLDGEARSDGEKERTRKIFALRPAPKQCATQNSQEYGD